jgi:putative Holliday junction resolvase
MTARAQRFGRQLAGRFGLPVEYADERHTTHEASSALAEAGLRGTRVKDVRDRVAAQLILQGWLDDRPR